MIFETPSMCSGYSTTLSDATTGGTWSSSNSNAIVASGVGVVIGAAAGTATITYTAPSGCYTTTVVTVNETPAAIATGAGSVCVGSTIALTNSTTGGAWASSSIGTATISSSGIVSGVASGTVNISYTLATGCKSGASIVVNPLPSTIAGTQVVCTGATTSLTNSITGGTWSSSNGNATVGTGAGVVTGVAAGTAVISYTRPTSCYRTAIVTINASPAAISTGTGTVCSGSSINLSSATSGGTWTSSSAAVAPVGSSTGVITGGTAGTATVAYTLASGCMATSTITVNALPAAIAGAGLVCTGATTTLTNSTTGGTWSSSNGNATVGTAAGVVTGVTAGTAVISYTRPTGCYKTATVTINASPSSIAPGSTAICSGSTLSLTDATSGGTWTSSSNTIATVGTNGVVTGAGTGVATIAYTVATGCKALASITVNPLPAAITGVAKVCTGLTTTLMSATTGGTWSASNTNASVETGAGAVTGSTAGTTIISYALATGCYKAVIVTVNPTPATISGANTMGTSTTTALSIATTGGTWASGATTVATINSAGVVNGVAPGTVSISYNMATGCRSTKTITVNLTPAPITGTASVCATHNTTLSDATAGGSWSINNTAVATIDSTGTVTGVGAGNTTVSYTMPTGTFRTIVVTVNPLPNAGTLTASSTTVGVGGTVLLSNSAVGGVLTSSSTAIATVTAGGTVTGVSIGSATITYTSTNGCGTATTTVAITVTAGLGRGAGSSTVETSNTVVVFPNPTNSGNLTVKTGIAGTFQVYDMSGKSVGQYTITEGSTLISLPNGLAAGMYLGRFTDNDGGVNDVRIVYKP